MFRRYRRTQLWKFNLVMPVFKRSITASRSTKNYQFRLITFGSMSKSVKRIFQTKLKRTRFFNRNALHIWVEKHIHFERIFRGNTLEPRTEVGARNLSFRAKKKSFFGFSDFFDFWLTWPVLSLATWIVRDLSFDQHPDFWKTIKIS